MLKVGIVGNKENVLSRIKQWGMVGCVQVVGYHLDDNHNSDVIPGFYSFVAFSKLAQAVDIIDIVSEDARQIEHIYEAIHFQKHLFLHNPFVLDVPSLQHIAKLIQEAKIKCQVGLYLRFLKELQPDLHTVPLKFIDIKCAYQAGDLMLEWQQLVNNHIDIVLKLLKSHVRKIFANSVAVEDNIKDLVNIRMQFDNGAIGDILLNSSAIRLEHILSLYGIGYVSEIEVIQDKHHYIPEEAVNAALNSFISDIQQDNVTKVTIFDAINSVELASEIVKQIES
ncbi:hypothetical protein D3C80_1167710 [compost metagenome]